MATVGEHRAQPGRRWRERARTGRAVDPQGEVGVRGRGEGDGEPLFCCRFPEKGHGMEECKVTETG